MMAASGDCDGEATNDDTLCTVKYMRRARMGSLDSERAGFACNIGANVARPQLICLPSRSSRPRLACIRCRLSFLWIPLTLIAAAAQTARNATQRSLTESIGMVGATQVRFLYGLPFALLFMLAVCLISGATPPAITWTVFLFALAAALFQILATALMLTAMQAKSFSVTTAYIKTEPILTAVVGFLLLGDSLTPLKVLGILVATAGVLLLTARPETLKALMAEAKPALTGIAAGGCFGLSAVMFRGAILALPEGSFVLRATTILALGLAIQTALLLVYLLIFDRTALLRSLGVWKSSLQAGFLGAFASQFWFLGFALTSAANVRTLALVEVFFAQIVSRKLFAEAHALREYVGMALMVIGVGLVLINL
jgi:drug/metabolite transporter (DMT)-like permease